MNKKRVSFILQIIGVILIALGFGVTLGYLPNSPIFSAFGPGGLGILLIGIMLSKKIS